MENKISPNQNFVSTNPSLNNTKTNFEKDTQRKNS